MTGSRLASRAPRPALADHPAFALMLLTALERFHCSLGEIREDYWMGRVWRALAGDPDLKGRVARRGVSTILLTGGRYGPAPASALERELLRTHVWNRVIADTGKAPNAWELRLAWVDDPIEIRTVRHHSLLAQVTLGDARWGDLSPYAADLAHVSFNVADLARAAIPAG